MLDTAINDYLAWLKSARNSKTHTAYRGALATFLSIVGPNADLSQKTYARFLKSTTDMNPSTQALCRSAIKGLYYFMANEDPGIPVTFFKQTDRQLALKSPKRLPIFNREGIEQIIEHVNTIRNEIAGLRDRAFVLLLADTGLRVSEACSLRVGDVDWNEGRLAIIGKGDKQALVHVSNRVMDALRDYLRGRNSSKSLPLFIRHDKKAGDKILPVTAGGMWHAIKQRATEAGVDPKTIRVHDFRHYFVTIVYHAKGIKAAQTLARHERIETTSRYTHLVENEGEAYDEIFNAHKSRPATEN